MSDPEFESITEELKFMADLSENMGDPEGALPYMRYLGHIRTLEESDKTLRQQLADVSNERDLLREDLFCAKQELEIVKEDRELHKGLKHEARGKRDAILLKLNASEARNAELCRLLVKGGSVIDQMGLAIGAADEYGDFEHEIKDAQELAEKMISAASQSAPATDEQGAGA